MPANFTGVSIGDYIFIHKYKAREGSKYRFAFNIDDKRHYLLGFRTKEFDFFGPNINDYCSSSILRVYVNGNMIKELETIETNTLGKKTTTDLMAIMLSRVITTKTVEILTFSELFNKLANFELNDEHKQSLDLFGIFALTKDYNLRFVHLNDSFLGDKHYIIMLQFTNVVPLSFNEQSSYVLATTNTNYRYIDFEYLAITKKGDIMKRKFSCSPGYLRYFKGDIAIQMSDESAMNLKNDLQSVNVKKLIKPAIKRLFSNQPI